MHNSARAADMAEPARAVHDGSHGRACHVYEVPGRTDGVVQIDPVAGRLIQAAAGERDFGHVIHVRVLVEPHPAAAAGREECVVQTEERELMLHRRILTGPTTSVV